MATRNFVPRNNNEGSIGLTDKNWANAFINTATIKSLNVDAIQKTSINTPTISNPTLTGSVIVPTADAGTNNTVAASTMFVNNAIVSKADLKSPIFTGTPTAPTPSTSTSSTQLATTAFVHNVVNSNNNSFQQAVLPVGVVVPFAGNNTIPTNFLLCDGREVNRITYSDLYAVIGTIYGAGNGSNTFNLPNLTSRFIEGSTTAGTTFAAGLPNITATGIVLRKKFAGGAISSQDIEEYAFVSGTTWYIGFNDSKAMPSNEFDASRCSSIYGNSTTVQPPAITMRYIIKYK